MMDFGLPPVIAKPAIIRPRTPELIRPGDPRFVVPKHDPSKAMFAVTGLTGFGAGSSSGTRTDLYQPGGTTRQLAIGFKSDATTFTTNTISGAITGTLTRDSGAGPDGNAGFATAWSASNYISFTSFDLYDEGGKTFIVWYKGTQTNASAGGLSAGVIFIGGTNNWMGLSAGVLAANNDAGAITSSGTAINDDSWHMAAFSVPGNSTTAPLKVYRDGVYLTDLQEGADGNNYPVSRISSATGGSIVAYPTALAGIQIYGEQLSDANITAIYNAAVTGV